MKGCVCLIALILGASVYADEGRFKNEWDETSGGGILYKFSTSFIQPKSKHYSMPPSTSEAAHANGTKDSDLLYFSGLSAGISASIFANKYLAFEVSAGVQRYGVNFDALKDVAYNYSDTPDIDVSSVGSVTAVPLSFGLQVHLMPDQKIKPYVGFGYNIVHIATTNNFFSTQHATGMYAQVGVNVLTRDDRCLFFEVKKYLLNRSPINYKRTLVDSPQTAIRRLDHLVFSCGMGWKI